PSFDHPTRRAGMFTAGRARGPLGGNRAHGPSGAHGHSGALCHPVSPIRRTGIRRLHRLGRGHHGILSVAAGPHTGPLGLTVTVTGVGSRACRQPRRKLFRSSCGLLLPVPRAVTARPAIAESRDVLYPRDPVTHGPHTTKSQPDPSFRRERSHTSPGPAARRQPRRTGPKGSRDRTPESMTTTA